MYKPMKSGKYQIRNRNRSFTEILKWIGKNYHYFDCYRINPIEIQCCRPELGMKIKKEVSIGIIFVLSSGYREGKDKEVVGKQTLVKMGINYSLIRVRYKQYSTR